VAHARSDRDVLTAEFVRRGGRAGHEGLFPIIGSPIAGRPAILRVALTEPEERLPVFELFSSEGRPIQRVTLDRVEEDEFVGEIELPASATLRSRPPASTRRRCRTPEPR